MVALNRAVALAELEGPAVAYLAVEELDLDDYHLFHATRAELLVRLGRPDEAAVAFERALVLTNNAAERAHLDASPGRGDERVLTPIGSPPAAVGSLPVVQTR